MSHQEADEAQEESLKNLLISWKMGYMFHILIGKLLLSEYLSCTNIYL